MLFIFIFYCSRCLYIIGFRDQIQKVGKNIKVLKVPQQAQNFQLQIWTNVFRGPIIQYFLSDTFDGQIVLNQHITEFYNDNKSLNTENEFIIIENHNAFESLYKLKFNGSHFQTIQNPKLKTTYIEVPQQIKNQQFLKSIVISSNQHQGTLIGVLSVEYIVFIDIKQMQVIGIFQHNISISQSSQNPLPWSSNIEVLGLSERNKNIIFQNNLNQIHSDQLIEFSLDFTLAVWIQNQIQDESQTITGCNFHQFKFSYINSSDSEVKYDYSKKHILEEEIIDMKSVESSNQLLVLTYTQNLLVFQIKQTQNRSNQTNQLNQNSLQLTQTINLKDQIPIKYRSSYNKYVSLQVFPSFTSGNQIYKNNRNFINKTIVRQNFNSNITLLLFSQTDSAFHLQIVLFKQQGKQMYAFLITNIYAGYQNFQYSKTVHIGLISNKEYSINQQEINNSDQSSSYTTKQHYAYFLIQFQEQTLEQQYLIYYGYNYNYSQNGEAGYFKCGQKISKSLGQTNLYPYPQNTNTDLKTHSFFNRQTSYDQTQSSQGQRQSDDYFKSKFNFFNIPNTKNEHNQNSHTGTHHSQINDYKQNESKNGTYYFYHFNQYSIEVQQIKATINPSQKRKLTQKLQLKENQPKTTHMNIINQKYYNINTSIFMILNYQKPPVVTYIILNARNFNAMTGIYTKFIFLTRQMTWKGFYISIPFVILFIICFACLLKKYQTKQKQVPKKQIQQQEIIISRSSNSRDQKYQKQQRLICISQEDQDDSSNQRQSIQRQSYLGYSPRFGYVSSDKNRQSSLLESPFRSSNNSKQQKIPQNISESDIEQVPQVKFDEQEQNQVLRYLNQNNRNNEGFKRSFG